MAMHDLDEHNEAELRAHIESAIATAKTKARVVLIPKHEIESWLMYDPEAIATAFKQTKLIKLPANPEGIKDAKEHLGKLIWKHYHKIYLHTAHNEQIAKRVRIASLSKAKSFAPHPLFVAQIKADLKNLKKK